jgi:hypothetical protein
MRTSNHHAAAIGGKLGGTLMDDLLWLSIMVGLLAATLAYVRLCDNA